MIQSRIIGQVLDHPRNVLGKSIYFQGNVFGFIQVLDLRIVDQKIAEDPYFSQGFPEIMIGNALILPVFVLVVIQLPVRLLQRIVAPVH